MERLVAACLCWCFEHGVLSLPSRCSSCACQVVLFSKLMPNKVHFEIMFIKEDPKKDFEDKSGMHVVECCNVKYK